MKQSPSWKAKRFLASQEIPRILRNLKVYYRTHKCQSPLTTLKQFNTVHAHHPTSLRSTFIPSSHLRLSLPSDLFPSGFPTKTLYAPLLFPHACYMPRPSHSSWFDHPNNILWGIPIKLLIYFSPLPILKHLQPTFLPQYQRPSFTPIQNNILWLYQLYIWNKVEEINTNKSNRSWCQCRYPHSVTAMSYKLHVTLIS